MTTTPDPADPDQADEVPPGSPVPGESAPLHESGSSEQPPPTSRDDDEDEAANPHGVVISSDDDS
jgi:hypothetical protein